ncbi:hypothetical protein RvY_10559 [Ramazzottius varieornatus]|uniref:Alternative oxidase n=1 Tax=Ramazzottius varieornatus TaxID=947166 RepID=A0A1D1VHN1_RAMVA|nr:hypothetical protein RvY_10559 [Ramazzottius varieornatus]
MAAAVLIESLVFRRLSSQALQHFRSSFLGAQKFVHVGLQPQHGFCTSFQLRASQSKATGSYNPTDRHADSEQTGPNSRREEVASEAEVAKEVSDQALPHFKIQKEMSSQEQGMKMSSGKKGEFRYPEPDELVPKEAPAIGVISLPHPIWSREQLDSVVVAHKAPKGFVDWCAYLSVQALRKSFDLTSGYTFGKKNEANWLRRIIFLETVAGVPGMMGAMVRHLKSLRSLKRDNGWIHTLLEEAENERMHLMVALQIKQPGKLFRLGAVVTQGIFVNMFFLAYLASPKFCHRFVGYLEEEAVKTYTTLLDDIASGRIPQWTDRPAPKIAIDYWKLPEGATFYDMFAAIRADEAHHRLVNHTLSSMQSHHYNPFKPGA